MPACFLATMFVLLATRHFAATPVEGAVQVRIVTDEADAVLAILGREKAHQPVSQADWQRLFKTDGYRRLKAREARMGRAFEDASFQDFVRSDSLLSRSDALAKTLDRWKHADLSRAAALALAYLPRGARLKAKIYPVIKPRENSFVYEDLAGRAIFLYLDPNVTREQFENTLAHELHHTGYASCCPSRQAAREIAALPPNVQTLVTWIGAFGEGLAMLAAAGGPDVHPHAVSKPDDRDRWDADMANFDADLKKVEQFFQDVLEGRLTEPEAIRNQAYSFFGIQGPWYTVGWKMAVTIEKTFNRDTLIACMLDPRKLLPTYNRAASVYNGTATSPLALWSPSLIAALGGDATPPHQEVRADRGPTFHDLKRTGPNYRQ